MRFCFWDIDLNQRWVKRHYFYAHSSYLSMLTWTKKFVDLDCETYI